MEAGTFHRLGFTQVLHILSRYAVSESGRQAAKSCVPYTTFADLQAENALLEQMICWQKRQNFILMPFEDVSGVCAALVGQHELDFDACRFLYEMLQIGRNAREVFRKNEGLGEVSELAKFLETYDFPENLWLILNRCLAANGTLKDESSPELYSVRTEIRRIHSLCTRKVYDFFEGQDTGFLQSDLLTLSADRYVLALKVNYKRKFSGIVHDYSQSGETCYFEPMFLVELNNRLQELKREELLEERKVLLLMSEIARSCLDELQAVFHWLTRLDVLLAKIRFANECQGRVLAVGNDCPLCLRQARNPLLVFGKGKTVPVDIQLKEKQRALIVSGGNSGGKTVCLKTWGLIALMVLSGLPVPVGEESSMPWYDSVFVFMGDEQDLEANLSTFSGQIHAFSAAWNQIDKCSLVLLDEFGTGTDPEQGSALARSVLAALLERSAQVGMATHFPALKVFAMTHESVRSATVLFDPQSKKPLYRLAYDQVGESQAFVIAKEYGMPPHILEQAYRFMRSGENREALFERLNVLSAEREKEIAALQAEREKLEEKMQRQRLALQKEKERLANEVRQKTNEIFSAWKAEKLSCKAALKKLAELRKELENLPLRENLEYEPSGTNDFTVGQTVLYPAWEKNGVIMDIDNRKKSLRLDLGGISVWVGLHDVLPVEKQIVREEKPFLLRQEKRGSFRIDIRGYRAGEVVSIVEKFLDNALLAGFDELEIIHGKGSGVLKEAVHELLGGLSFVASYEFASADCGGEGVTLARLR